MGERSRRETSVDLTRVGVDAVAHLADLRRTSRALTTNRADADDLVQDVYVRALRAASRFQPGTNLKAWLMTILRNLASNHRRDSRRLSAHVNAGCDPGEAATPAPEPSPEEVMIGRAFAPQLQAALESLPKSLRDTVWLRDVDELTYAQIAVRLRIPVGTVMSRISRGRRLLHDRLAAATPAISRLERHHE